MGTARRTFSLAAALVLSWAPALVAQTYPTAPDPRNGLKPGKLDAGIAQSGMKLVSFSPKPPAFDSTSGLTFINSDLAFRDHYVYQGNFSGFMVWDVKNPAKPVLAATVVCVTAQGDPSIIGHLLFVSAEGDGNRNDCAKGGIKDTADHTSHMTGVRIYDVSNPRAPKLVKNIQTCKGSHTHTVIPDPKDKGVVYIYVSGQSNARPETELAGLQERQRSGRRDELALSAGRDQGAARASGASRGGDGRAHLHEHDAGAAERGSCVSRQQSWRSWWTRRYADRYDAPRPAADRSAQLSRRDRVSANAPAGRRVRELRVARRRFESREAGASRRQGRHELLALAHCCLQQRRLEGRVHGRVGRRHGAQLSGDEHDGNGRQRDPHDQRRQEVHAARVLQDSDGAERAGELRVAQRRAHSRAGPRPDGAGLVSGRHRRERFHGPRSSVRGRVLRPRPGRLAGGFDDGRRRRQRGGQRHECREHRLPAGGTAGRAGGGGNRFRNTIGGSWGAYYWNGYIYSSELARGFDILELLPSDKLSANELAAAKLVRFTEYNPQSQPHIVWPAAFPVVRSYLDQLVRDNGLSAERTTAIAKALDAAEKQTGAARGASLTKLAKSVDGDVAGAKDQARAKSLSAEIKRLAAVSK